MSEIKKAPDDPPNWRDKDGNLYLRRCHECGAENYALNVSSGICTWCGWREEKKEPEAR